MPCQKNSRPAKQTIALIGATSAEGKAVLACLLPSGHRLLLMDEAAKNLSGLQQQVQPRCETGTRQNEQAIISELEQHQPHSKIVFLQLPTGASTPPVISGGNKSAVETVCNLFKTANRN